MMFDCESPDCMPKDILHQADILLYDGMYENETCPLHIVLSRRQRRSAPIPYSPAQVTYTTFNHNR